MTEIAKLNPKTSALLTLDCQKGIVQFVPGSDRIFKPVAKVLEAVEPTTCLSSTWGLALGQGTRSLARSTPPSR